MSDGILLNAGSGGSTLQTDDIGGVHYQVIKIAFGADGTATYVHSSVGAAFPVSILGAVSGTVNAAQSGTWTVGSSLSGPVSVTGTVDVSIAGGTINTNTSVNANQAGSWTITANAGTGTFQTSVVGPVSITGAVAASLSGPVSIVGTVEVSVKGPVSASQSGTWTVQPGNTANTTAWLVSVQGTTQVSIVGPVSGTVVANAGTGNFQVSVVAGLSILSGHVSLSGPVSLAASTAVVGTVLIADKSQVMYDSSNVLTSVKYLAVGLSATGTIIASVASKKIRVVALALIANATISMFIKSCAGGNLFGTSTNKALIYPSGGFVLSYNPHGWFETSIADAVQISLDTGTNVAGSVNYIEVS